MAELGFLGDIVTTLLTIPLAWGHLFSIGVLDSVGYLYLGPDFKCLVLRLQACLHVANYISFTGYSYYITKDCHENPSQYINAGTPRKSISSRVERSTGAR